MIRSFFTLFVTLLATLPASAQLGSLFKPKPTPTPQAQPTPWANKFFVPGFLENPNLPVPAVITHDFGTVPHGTLCTKKFTITNIYAVPIQVVDVRVECGCLKAYPPEKVLQPNESADFTVTMNTAVFNGKSSKLMRVTFGPNFVSTAELRLEANSRTDIVVSQPGQIDFSTVAQGSDTSKEVVVSYHGNARGWKITEMVPTKGPYTVEVRERPNSPRGGIEYTVTAKLKPDAPSGEINDSISLKTNDPNAPLISVGIRGSIRAPLTAVPGKVDFKEVMVGQTATQKVLVKSGTECALVPVAEDADGVSIDVFQTTAMLHYVTVKFNPRKPGPVNKEVVLKSNLPGGASAIIVVQGVGK